MSVNNADVKLMVTVIFNHDFFFKSLSIVCNPFTNFKTSEIKIYKFINSEYVRLIFHENFFKELQINK